MVGLSTNKLVQASQWQIMLKILAHQWSLPGPTFNFPSHKWKTLLSTIGLTYSRVHCLKWAKYQWKTASNTLIFNKLNFNSKSTRRPGETTSFLSRRLKAANLRCSTGIKASMLPPFTMWRSAARPIRVMQQLTSPMQVLPSSKSKQVRATVVALSDALRAILARQSNSRRRSRQTWSKSTRC